MRIETNERLVRRNRRIANFLFFFSMAILIAGFIGANTQLAGEPSTTGAIVSLLVPLILPVGFISTLISIRMTNQWVRRPHPEDAIPEGLKGLSKRSVLYNYYHGPAKHVLITPQGTYAIITRFQDSSYVVDGEKWQSGSGVFGAVTRIFRQDGVGNPTQDARKAATHLEQLLKPTLPDIEVQPLIVFTDPRAKLDIKNPAVPVLYADIRKEPNLRDYMRDAAQQRQVDEDPKPQNKKKGSDKGNTNDPKGITPEAVADALEEVTIVT